MENYIVTGYKGFVGSHLIQKLDSYIGFDKDDHYDEEKIERSKGIYHIGACADLRNTDLNYMFYYNFERSIELFKLAKKYNKKVVFASSSAIYGNGELPLNSYAWSKYSAEIAGKGILGNNFTSLRFFNIYGPGENIKGNMSSIPFNIYNSKKFGIFSQSKENHVSPIRDFIHIEDIISACLVAMNNNDYGIFDVGTSTPIGYDKICDLYKKEYYFFDDEKKPIGYQDYTCANKSKFLPDWNPIEIQVGLLKYKRFLESE
jgi:ADP-L-glycero-D-manno-heptose 6-epimerase